MNRIVLNLLSIISIVSDVYAYNLTEKEILFSGVDCPPYIILDSENNFVGGYEYELIKLISEKLHFGYELVKPIDQNYGQNLNGSWTGLVGRIERKEIHMGVPSLFITYEGSLSIDYARYHRFSEVIFIVRAPKRKDLLTAIFMPFSMQIWLSIFFSIIITGIILHQINKQSCIFQQNVKYWTILEAYWFLFGTLLFKGGDLRNIKHYSLQLIIGFWWLAALVIGYGYTGCLFSFLSYPEFEYVPSSFIELQSEIRKGKFKYGTLKLGGVDSLMRSSEEGIAQIINDEIRKEETNLVHSLEEGVKRVFEENYVFIEDSTAILEIVNKLGTTNFILSQDSIFSTAAAFGIPKGLPYRDRMNSIIRKIFESGIIEKLLKDEFLKSKSYNNDLENPAVKVLTLQDLLSPFIVLITGYTISALALVIELFSKWQNWSYYCFRK